MNNLSVELELTELKLSTEEDSLSKTQYLFEQTPGDSEGQET